MTVATTVATTEITEAPPEWMESMIGRFEQMDNDALIAELKRALSVTTESLQIMATVVRVLESRGVSIEELRINPNIAAQIRRIAHGILLPEVVLAFMSRRSVLKAVSKLPISDQIQIVAKPTVDVAVVENSTETSRCVAVLDLQSHQVSQVFGDGIVRTVEAQHAWMRQHPRLIAVETASASSIPYEWDDETKELIVFKPTRISQLVILEMAKRSLGSKPKRKRDQV